MANNKLTGSKWVMMIEQVRDQGASRETVVERLKELGYSNGSSQAIATFIMSMAKPNNSILLRDVKNSKISIRQARKLSRAHGGQGRVPLTPAERMIKALKQCSEFAVLAGYNEKQFTSVAGYYFKKNLDKIYAKKQITHP